MPRFLNKFFILFITTVAIAFGISFLSTAQARTKFFYTVTELNNLGYIGQGHVNFAYDINDSGQVVGFSYASNGEMRSVVWENGIITADWRLIGSRNYASAINNAGQVAANSTPNSHTLGKCPSLWEKGNFVANIGECGGTSYVNGINNAGQVVGWSLDEPFVWKDGVTTPLSLPGRNTGGSQATDINDGGQAVGHFHVQNPGILQPDGNTISVESTSHAALWQPKGKIKDLGILPGGKYSDALSINRFGQVAGWADTSDKTKHAVLWQRGVIKDLGLLQNNATQATSINNLGTVVGYSTVATEYSKEVPEHGFVWKNGNMRDLNKLLPANSGWAINTATSINNRGQIVGQGTFNGENKPYLLTPTWLIN